MTDFGWLLLALASLCLLNGALLEFFIWLRKKENTTMIEQDSNDDDINPRDLRIDSYRVDSSSGWLVKPETGVRITHIPSGITISEHDDRSIHRNKAEAMRKMRVAYALAPQMFQAIERMPRAEDIHNLQMELFQMAENSRRYLKLKQMLAAGVSASIESRQEKLYYEAIPDGEVYRYQVYPITPIGSETTAANTLDELIDSIEIIYPPV